MPRESSVSREVSTPALLKLLRAEGPLRSGQIASRLRVNSEAAATSLKAAGAVCKQSHAWSAIDAVKGTRLWPVTRRAP